MKRWRSLNWPLLGLGLYFVVLFIAGLVYAGSQVRPAALRLTGVSVLSADDQIELSLRGVGVDKSLRGYLSLDTANHRAVVGSLPAWGQSTDVEIVDDTLFVLQVDEGVKVLDLSTPLTPELIRHIPARLSPWHIDADESHLYLSSMTRGVVAYELGTGVTEFTLEAPGMSYSSIHNSGQIFVACGHAGVSIFDISDHRQGRLISRATLPGESVALARLENYLLVAAKAGGLHLLDVSDVKHPRLLQTLVPQKRYDNVTLVGRVVYASDNDIALDVFKFNAAGRLELQSSFPLHGNVHDFLLDGERLFLAESSYGVTVLDVSDPLYPQRLGYVLTPGEPRGLALYKELLYVASSSQGVQIVDTRRFVTQKSPVVVDTPGNAVSLALDGRWMYVADGLEGVQIIDRNNMEDLNIVANVKTGGKADIVVKSGDMLYLAVRSEGLQIYDVRIPTSPRLVSSLLVKSNLSDLMVRGTSLFASSLNKKLLRIDISDPWYPWVAESIDLPGRAWRLAQSGADVLVADGKAGLQIVRFESHQPGRIISNLTRSWPMNDFVTTMGIAVHGDYAYLTQRGEGLQIVDISNPDKPKEIRVQGVPGQSLDVELTDQFAVVSDRWWGYYFVNIRDPENSYIAAKIFQPRSKSGFVIENGLLYSPGTSNGVSVLPLPVEAHSVSGPADITLQFEKPTHAGWYDLTVSDGRESVSRPAVVEVY